MKQSRRTLYWLVFLLTAGVVLALDQLTKRYIISTLDVYETVQPIPALAPLFQITRTENTGSAFGFLPQAGDIFLILAFVIAVGMLYFYPRIPDGKWMLRISLGMILGGALGNAFDRLQYGLVVDFIHYQIPPLGISNVSNLADHGIVLGAILVFIDSWRDSKQAESPPPPSEEEIPTEKQEHV